MHLCCSLPAEAEMRPELVLPMLQGHLCQHEDKQCHWQEGLPHRKTSESFSFLSSKVLELSIIDVQKFDGLFDQKLLS